jgi:hypothetical protein
MTRRNLLAVLSSGLVLAGAAASVAAPLRASATAVTDYQFSPDSSGQFLARGTLTAPNQATTVTVKAVNGSTGVSGATVYLSNTGAGIATVAAVCGATSATLSATPVACTTGVGGTITISFQAPATVPTGGVDTITAQDDPTTPTLTRSVRYYWGATTQLVFDAAHVPIAQPGAA